MTIDPIEEAIGTPAPGQLQLLLDHTWLLYEHMETVTFQGRAFLFSSEKHYDNFLAHRERDKLPNGLGDGWYEPRLPFHEGPARLSSHRGAELFARLVELPDFQEVSLNSGSTPGAYLMAEFARQALAGVDIRPGARKLQARSEDEMELYLGQHAFHPTGREGNRFTAYGRTVEFEDTFVEGRTRILCMACLANLVVQRAVYLAPSVREQSLSWAYDVLNHMEDDRLPESTIRVPYGRHLVAQNPSLLEGDTIRAALAKLLKGESVTE